MIHEDLEIGDIFTKPNENPFEDDAFVQVLAVKNGYVQYRFIFPKERIISTIPSSGTLDHFRAVYKTKIKKTIKELLL